MRVTADLKVKNDTECRCTMARKSPYVDSFWGYPLYYRIEQRTTSKVVLISLRDISTTRPQIIYECTPMGGHNIQQILDDVDLLYPEGKGLLAALPPQYTARAMDELIGLGTEDARLRRKTIPGLTFGMLITADRNNLIHGTGERKKSTEKDEERVLDSMLAKFGDKKWKDVTPTLCADWLAHKSEHDRKTCKRVMLRYEYLLLSAGLLSELSWYDYDPRSIKRKSKTHKGLVKAHLEASMLTTNQCRTIVQSIVSRIAEGNVSGIDIAILLKLATELDIEYIAALNLDDFEVLADYKDRLVVIITRFVSKATSNYMLHNITDPYERRRIPLPHLIKDCYYALMVRKNGNNLSSPLVPDKRNANRRMSPQDLRNEMAAYLQALQIRRVTDTPGIKLLKPIDLFLHTTERELRKNGLEEEELRLIKGEQPQLVSGKHYYDRNNEAALNKIGAIMDRWFGCLYSSTLLKTGAVELRGNGSNVSWVTSLPNRCTQVHVAITIPPVPLGQCPKDGVELELQSLHGMSGTIIIKEQTPNG